MPTHKKKAAMKKPTSKVKQSAEISPWYRSRRAQLVLFVVVFAAIGGFALFKSFAATASFYLQPTSTSVTPGQTFSVAVRINPGTAIDTVDATLTYDPALLQFNAIDGSTSAFPTEVVANGGSGTVLITRTALAPLTVSTDSLIATVSFTALKAGGPSALQLSGNVAYQGNSVSASVTNGSVTVAAPADTTSPNVTVSSPADGATGSKFQIAATATDNVGVTKMEVYTDSRLASSSTSGSINYTWTLKGKATKGTHTIVVKAYDAAGNVQSVNRTVY